MISRNIRERYNRLYEEDIRMGNICSDDIPTEEEVVEDFYDSTESECMEAYYEKKYAE